MKKNKIIVKDNNIIGIQKYSFDEWVNTEYTLESLQKEVKRFESELQKMYIESSDFHNETYFYIDQCGHTILFRVVDTWNKKYWDIAKHKLSKDSCKGKNISFESIEEIK